MTFDNLIRQHGFNQTTLAKKLDMTGSAINRIAIGKTNRPQIETIRKISVLFGIPMGAVIDCIEESKRQYDNYALDTTGKVEKEV